MVVAGGNERKTVRSISQHAHNAVMARQGADFPVSLLHIPKTNDGIRAGRSQLRAVGRECNGLDRARMADQFSRLGSRQVPELGLAGPVVVAGPTDDAAPVGRKGHGAHPFVVSGQDLIFAMRRPPHQRAHAHGREHGDAKHMNRCRLPSLHSGSHFVPIDPIEPAWARGVHETMPGGFAFLPLQRD